MALLRKIALGLLLASAVGVLGMASWELWNYRDLTESPQNASGFSVDDRAQVLQYRMETLTKRVGDMQLLVLILLGTSGLYAIVFVASSYFSATSFARQADQTINNIQDQIGLAMGDLRELQEETEKRVRELTAEAAKPTVPPPVVTAAVPEPAPVPAQSSPTVDWEAEIGKIGSRLAALRNTHLDERARTELVQDEFAALRLDVLASPSVSSAFADVYFRLAMIYSSSDGARSKFYLERALRLAPADSALASEIHYQLACRYAASHDFPYALRELTAAFEHQFKALDEKLAGDIEEGGKLYELASTAPFDKAVNDLLLNMSIGIG